MAPGLSRLDVRVGALDVPLAKPFRISYDTIVNSTAVMARAQLGDAFGFGEGSPIAAIVAEDREAALASARQAASLPINTSNVSDLGRSLSAVSSPAARAAIEGSAFDAMARAAEVPLAVLLGAQRPASVASSITIPLMEPADFEARVDHLRRMGVRIFKLKAGTEVSEDVRRVVRLRDLVGTSAEIRVDPNQGWSRRDAEEAMPKLRDAGVSWLEQPLAKQDLVGHARLRSLGQVPVMLDESVFTANDARAAIRAKAADGINIKLQKCGGALEGQAIADVSRDAGLPCMVGCMLETRVGIAHAAHLALSHPTIELADLDGPLFLADDPVRGGPAVEAGRILVGSDAGTGIQGVEGTQWD